MSKLKVLWNTFKKSLLEPVYYHDVLKAPFLFSIKYIFGLLFIILFVKGLIFGLITIPFLPKIPQYVGESKVFLKNLYPNDLTLTLKDGTVRTNMDEPYVVPFPDKFKTKDMSLLVIDTKAKVEDIKKYQTIFFLTKNALVYPDSQSKDGYRVNFLTDYKGYAIFNKQVYNQLFAHVSPFFNYIPALVYILLFVYVFFGPFLGIPFYFTLVLLYLIVMSAILLLIAQLMKKNLSYKSILQLSMHGITFSLMFDFLKFLLKVEIPFAYTLSFFMWMIIVFHALKINDTSRLPAK